MIGCKAINEAGQREGRAGRKLARQQRCESGHRCLHCPKPPDLTHHWESNHYAKFPWDYIKSTEGKLQSSLEKMRSFWIQGGRWVLPWPLGPLCLQDSGPLVDRNSTFQIHHTYHTPHRTFPDLPEHSLRITVHTGQLSHSGISHTIEISATWGNR